MLRHSSNARNVAVMIPQTIRRYKMGPVSVSIVTSMEPCRGACLEGRSGQARGKPVFNREYSTLNLNFHYLASNRRIVTGTHNPELRRLGKSDGYLLQSRNHVGDGVVEGRPALQIRLPVVRKQAQVIFPTTLVQTLALGVRRVLRVLRIPAVGFSGSIAA